MNEIFRDLNQIKGNYKIATLGYFDGVHLGHQKLLKTLKKIEVVVQEKVIITFIQKDKEHISSLKQKLELLEYYAPHIKIIIIDLDSPEIKNSSPEQFIAFLKRLSIEQIIVGSDYRFGTEAKGHVWDLQNFFEVNVVEFITINQQKISSTQIRKLLKQGSVTEVKKLLGYNYYIVGIVRTGNQLGRTINFPTLNIIEADCLLKNGVYKSLVFYKNKQYCAITNVGIKPTINQNNERTIETHIYDDFNQEIYGEEVKVEFLTYIRPEKKFNSLEELGSQIKEDLKIAKGEL